MATTKALCGATHQQLHGWCHRAQETRWPLADDSLSAEEGVGPQNPQIYFCYAFPKNSLCSRRWEKGPWFPAPLSCWFEGT